MANEKILTHVCCGPCATYVTQRLREQNFEIVGYYFNPNIYPRREYLKRLEVARKFFKEHKLEFKVGDYDPGRYYECIGTKTEYGQRCQNCYWLRLQRAAFEAANRQIPYFTTTLLISPYQNQIALREIGQRLARKYNLLFYEEDFVKGYQESRKMAREQGMYLQKYCGCRYSREESSKRKTDNSKLEDKRN